MMEPAHGLYLDAKELADGLAGFETEVREQLHNLGKDVAMLTDRVDALSEQPERSERLTESQLAVLPQYRSEVLTEVELARLPQFAVVVDDNKNAWQKMDGLSPWRLRVSSSDSGALSLRSPRLVWTPEKTDR